jgi:hypothetical protein
MDDINNSTTWSEIEANDFAPMPNMAPVKRFWDRINGTVTSGGSAGAYTYTPTDTAFPTAYAQGETYSFKANFTSVGGDTLNVNGLGAKPLYKPSTSGPVAIAAGDLRANEMVQAVYDSSLGSGGGFHVTSGLSSTGDVIGPASSTNNDIVLFDGTTGTVLKDSGLMLRDIMPIGQCRLQYVSATQIKLVPFNGCLIKIAGALYQFPGSGITAANTGLSANTLYYVYLFNSSGTLTLEFSATGHTTDTTAGNVGVEIKTGDNSRTLVGMVCTNGSAQFQDGGGFGGVASWFNRRRKVMVLTLTNPTITAGTTFTSLSAGVTVLPWGGDDILATLNGGAQIDTTNAGFQTAITVDTVVQDLFSPFDDVGAAANQFYPVNIAGPISGLSESAHNVNFYGKTTGSGTATWAGSLTVGQRTVLAVEFLG